MRHSSHGLRIALLAGASVVALAAAAPSAVAADMNKPMPMKAPPALPVAKDTWTWWIEGGAVKADSSNSINLGAGGIKPGWGPEGAVGFDWQPFAPMHVVGQFRYGSTTKSAPFAFGFSGVTPASGSAFTGKATGNQSLRDDHWLIDFAIGRDFGLGNSNAMWTLGVRVADLRAKLTANGSFVTTGATGTTGTFNTVQRSTFVGAGPRLGVQGDIPLGGQWSIDWLAGVAVLFGERSITQNTTVAFVSSTPPVVSTSAGASDTAAVFNADAQAGLSYWFSPNMKITASYRFDGYWRALKNVQATNGTTISLNNVDQFFSGPMLRLTSKF